MDTDAWALLKPTNLSRLSVLSDAEEKVCRTKNLSDLGYLDNNPIYDSLFKRKLTDPS